MGRKIIKITKKYFTTIEHKREYDSLLNEPKIAYRNKRLPFWLPTCLGISYSTA